MLGTLRKRLTYANVMSTFAVVLMLVTGTAYATHLVVRSSDVVDNTLVSADLRDGEAVTGADVVANSVRGGDIRESSLGQVPAATIGGLGRSAATPNCAPSSSAYERCVQVSLDLQRPARVLLNGRVTAYSEEIGAGTARCRWAGVSESGPVSLHVESGDSDISLVGLTSVIPAGSGWTFAIECNDEEGAIAYADAWITAVAISPN